MPAIACSSQPMAELNTATGQFDDRDSYRTDRLSFQDGVLPSWMRGPAKPPIGKAAPVGKAALGGKRSPSPVVLLGEGNLNRNHITNCVEDDIDIQSEDFPSTPVFAPRTSERVVHTIHHHGLVPAQLQDPRMVIELQEQHAAQNRYSEPSTPENRASMSRDDSAHHSSNKPPWYHSISKKIKVRRKSISALPPAYFDATLFGKNKANEHFWMYVLKMKQKASLFKQKKRAEMHKDGEMDVLQHSGPSEIGQQDTQSSHPTIKPQYKVQQTEEQQSSVQRSTSKRDKSGGSMTGQTLMTTLHAVSVFRKNVTGKRVFGFGSNAPGRTSPAVTSVKVASRSQPEELEEAAKEGGRARAKSKMFGNVTQKITSLVDKVVPSRRKKSGRSSSTVSPECSAEYSSPSGTKRDPEVGPSGRSRGKSFLGSVGGMMKRVNSAVRDTAVSRVYSASSNK